MSEEPTGNSTTLENVLVFFDRKPVDIDKTRDFALAIEADLASGLITKLKSTYPDIDIQLNFQHSLVAPASVASAAKSEETTVLRFDAFIEFPSSETPVIVEIKKLTEFETLQKTFQQFEHDLNLYSRDGEVRPYGVFLIAGDIGDSAQAAKVDEQVGSWLQASSSPFRVLTPQQSWPVFFEEYLETASQDRNGSAEEKEPGTSTETTPPDAARIYMLSDDALRGSAEDVLGFADYAAAFGGLINDEQTSTPLTLAINAKWGVGKTSLARMIEEHLVEGRTELGERPHVTYWFNAWMHDDATDLGQAFMTDIVRFANGLRPKWKRLLRPLPTSLYSDRDYRRRRWWIGAVLVVMALVASILAVQILNVDVIETLDIKTVGDSAPNASRIGSAALIFALSLVLLRYLASAFESISEFLSKRPSPADTGTLGLVREQLQNLLNNVVPEDSKFVVFIDDLERCRPTRSIDVLEVVNQLLSFPPVVTIIIADMAALAANAEIKYADLAHRYNPETGEPGPTGHAYGRLFLQKFIQLQFDLPEPSEPKIRNLIEQLSREAATSDQERPGSDLERIATWLRATFGDFGTTLIGLGPTLFVPWHPRASTGAYFWALMRLVPWTLRPLAVALWVPLLPYFWLLRLGRWASRAGQFRPATSWMTRIGKGVIVGCLVLSGLFAFWFVELKWVWAFGWSSPTNTEVGEFLTSWGLTAPSKGPPPLTTEIVRLVDYGSQLLVVYLPAAAAGLVVFLLGLVQRIRRIIEQRAQAKLFESDLRRDAANAPPSRPEHSLLGEHAWHALYLRKRQQYLTSDSTLFTDARDYAFNHLLLVPRNAKRLLNRLRLNLFILDQQGAFSNPSEFGPNHLGKWVALHERWPELAVAIIREPSIIEQIETAIPSAADSTGKKARKIIIGVLDKRNMQRRPADDGALCDLLVAQPRLSPVIRRLATFEMEKPAA